MPKSKFHRDLEVQKAEILKMGYLVKKLLNNSVLSLKNRDVKMANWVIKQGDKINNMDYLIEENLLHLIALNQPVAKDLRFIACGLKMITYIARIGRYGRDIAKVTIEISEEPHVAKLVNIPQMAQIASDMVDDCLKAFKKGELKYITDFEERDDILDEMRYSIFRECISYMLEDPKNITRCTNYAMVARYIERCGDHACKMAEKIHYMVTGEWIEIK